VRWAERWAAPEPARIPPEDRPTYSLGEGHWWRDTLFKRLFLLMWFGLAASHLIAFLVTNQVHAPPGGGDSAIGRLPVLPSLPPMGDPPGSMQRRGPPPGSPPGPPPDRPPGPPQRGAPDAGPGGLPAAALWLDYGVRFLAIGVVAWFGARWLSAPMRRLAAASEALGRALGHGRRGEPLDARRGTLEVRQTAQVFNTMAQRLHAQFDAQSLLMAAISHDLRTPLARLRLRLETMQDQPQTARCIADVHEMDALIASVLGMLREQHASAAPQRVDIAALAQSLVDDLVEQRAPACITAAPPAGVAIVLAQPAALRRVLGNLIGNALGHGGAARVSIELRAGAVHVAIDDDGPGIPADQLETAFEPFQRLARADAAGSGLGLYIARDLAQRNGAALTLANRAGGGLRAELALPLA
jgi:signal transduction histidine kinase